MNLSQLSKELTGKTGRMVPIKSHMNAENPYVRMGIDLQDGYYRAASQKARRFWADGDKIVEISVHIATSGRPDLLARTLASISECQLPAGYRETVVIENGGRSGAEQIVREAPAALAARYMHVDWGNKSHALNAALETSGDVLIIYTDDDVRLAPEALREYEQIVLERGRGYFYGGPINADYDAPPPEWLRRYLPCSAKGWELEDDSDAIDSAVFLGCNWAAFAGDLQAAGGFDVNFGPGSPTGSTGQETNMQQRLLERGLRGIYVPNARIWHYVPESRCTPEWAIQRNYRNGLQDAARVAKDANNPFGLPPWWVTRNYLRGMLGGVRGMLSTDPERRFRAKNRLSYERGVFEGVLKQVEPVRLRRAA
jgi:hypothetical protein